MRPWSVEEETDGQRQRINQGSGAETAVKKVDAGRRVVGVALCAGQQGDSTQGQHADILVHVPGREVNMAKPSEQDHRWESGV